MATNKNTKSFVDKVEFEKTGQKIYRDASLVGFALRVTQKSKTYIAERRKDGKNYRIAIGKHFEITATEARAKAESILTQIGTGEDPRKPQKVKKQIPALRWEVRKAWILLRSFILISKSMNVISLIQLNW